MHTDDIAAGTGSRRMNLRQARCVKQDDDGHAPAEMLPGEIPARPAPYRRLFHLSSSLTELLPRGGARFLDAAITASAGSRLLLDHLLGEARNRLRGVEHFDRILVVADLNIGDAILMQASVSALRDFLPDAQLDYVISKSATSLVTGNPEISELFSVFHGGPVPTREDVEAVRRLVRRGGYDVVFNFCPLLHTAGLVPAGTPWVDYKPLAAMLVRGQRDPATPNHIVARSHRMIGLVLPPLLEPVRRKPWAGVSIHVRDEAMERADRFLIDTGLAGTAFLLYNPDTSSRYTRVPVESQAALLRELAGLPLSIVLGAGHRERGIEKRLLDALEPGERERVRVLPASVPLDAYAAIVDAAAFFFSGDTGPLHLAAAHKVALDGCDLNNHTVVLSAFGATPARFYGYASGRPGFLPANQDAPSFVHIAGSPCRNLTCINKMAKTCREVRCFEQLDVRDLVQDVESCLDQARPCVVH